jgi:hypothetical protein
VFVFVQAKSSNVELSWPRRCVKGVYAEIDHYKLSQVLRNLVSNALKFTPAGGRVRVTAEVLTPGSKPRTARSLSALKEMDEDAAEDYESGKLGGDGSHAGSLSKSVELVENRRAVGSRAKRTKPKSLEFDDLSIANPGIIRSVSTDETPPHIYALPLSGSPQHLPYSTRGVLAPEISTATLTTTTTGAIAGYRGSTSAAPSFDLSMLSAAPSNDLEAGSPVPLLSMPGLAPEEGTAKLGTYSGFGTPAPITSVAQTGTASKQQQPHTVLRDSPESSDESSPPEKTNRMLPDNNMTFIKKLFSSDQERSNLQIFPSTNMLRISVTDSGAGISKVRRLYGDASLVTAVLMIVLYDYNTHRRTKIGCSRR